MKTNVYIIKRRALETTQDVVLRALKSIPLNDIINNSEKKILVNPNWVTSNHFSTGNVTSNLEEIEIIGKSISEVYCKF